MDFLEGWNALMSTCATVFGLWGVVLGLRAKRRNDELAKPIISNLETFNLPIDQTLCHITVVAGERFATLNKLEVSGHQIAWAVQTGKKVPEDVKQQTPLMDSIPIGITLPTHAGELSLFFFLDNPPASGFDIRLLTSAGEVFFVVPDRYAERMRDGAEQANRNYYVSNEKR